eukprot:2566403-Pyramimonas_sp.AAC.1
MVGHPARPRLHCRHTCPPGARGTWRRPVEHGEGIGSKEPWGREFRVWKPVELQSWMGHGNRRRPH